MWGRILPHGRTVRRIREEALPKLKGGLRALCRTLELPGTNPLKDAHAAHAALDAAVLAAPGIPTGFPQPETLLTEDCIRPAR